LVVEIVVVRCIASRSPAQIELPDAVMEIADQPRQARPRPQAWAALTEYDGKDVGDGALFDDNAAIHIRFAEFQWWIEEDAPSSLPLCGVTCPAEWLSARQRRSHFALELISFALAFELAVAGYLSDNFLHFAHGLLSGALDAIFVHHNGLQYFERSRIINRRNGYATKISEHYLQPLGPHDYVDRHGAGPME
jgi:hypothetical protein